MIVGFGSKIGEGNYKLVNKMMMGNNNKVKKKTFQKMMTNLVNWKYSYLFLINFYGM